MNSMAAAHNCSDFAKRFSPLFCLARDVQDVRERPRRDGFLAALVTLRGACGVCRNAARSSDRTLEFECYPELKKKKGPTRGPFVFFGAPGEIRTPDRPVRSRVLYPAELRAHCLFAAGIPLGHVGRSYENRKWRRERDSNPRRGISPYSLSRGALSTTQPSLRNSMSCLSLIHRERDGLIGSFLGSASLREFAGLIPVPLHVTALKVSPDRPMAQFSRPPTDWGRTYYCQWWLR